MRVKFIKTTKDIREGATKYYKGIPKAGDSHKSPSVIAISRELGEVYVKNGDAIEVDGNGDPIVRKVKSKEKIEEDGKV